MVGIGRSWAWWGVEARSAKSKSKSRHGRRDIDEIEVEARSASACWGGPYYGWHRALLGLVGSRGAVGEVEVEVEARSAKSKSEPEFDGLDPAEVAGWPRARRART